MSDALGDRRKELEEGFFAKQNQQLLEKLKAEKQKTSTKEGIKEVTGISNDEVLEFLVRLNLTQETISALALFPLIEVAWADGVVDAKETAAVLDAAHSAGVLKGSSSHTLLEGWLKLKPPATLHVAWYNYVRALVGTMKPEDKVMLKSELLGKARLVAEASGGVLGMGSKVSKAEREMLLAKVGFDRDDVHAYWRKRLAGKAPRRPQLKPLKQ